MTNSILTCRTIAYAFAALCVTFTLFAQSADKSWVESPEAAFLTNAERQEWFTLQTDAEREAFKMRYWAQRDPTPQTAQNEFRDVVMQRIDLADKKFTIDRKTRGALTWRGQAFVVLGPPARINVQQRGYSAPPLPPPPVGPFGSPGLTAGGRGEAEKITGSGQSTLEGNEITEHWYYERARTPKILDALGRPALDFTFIVEPAKQRDDLQNPGLFNEMRELVARKTILNDLPPLARTPQTPPVTTAAVPTVPAPPPVEAPQITPDIETALDHAGDRGLPLRSTVLWNGDAVAATFWLVAPTATKADGALTIYGRVKDASGKTVANVARTLGGTSGFSLRDTSGAVADATVSLTPGEYDAAFVLTNQHDVALASGTTHIIVPESQSQFSVSSLVLTDRVNAGGDGLAIGPARVRPRADATFTTAESLWYLFQVANPSDPGKVTVAVRLRHGTAPPSSPTVVPAALEFIGPARYMSGFEMPLSKLAPGDYTLYVSVHDPAGRDDVVRRADFRVIEAPRLQ